MAKKQALKRTLLLLMVCAMLMSAAVPCLATFMPQKRTVKVGFYAMSGFQNVNEDGTLSGYAYDYLQALAQYARWDLEYVTDYDWSQCLTALENGSVDLLCGVMKTEQREQVFDFPQLHSGLGYSCLAVDSRRTDIAFEDFNSFNGMTVGVAKNSARNQAFLDYCAANRFTVTLKTYNTEAQLEPAVLSGEVDAVMVTSNLKLSAVRVVAKFDPEAQYIATTKGNTALLEELNHALTRLKTDVPNFDDELYDRYFASNRGGPVVFTKEELAYIARHPTAQVMYDPAWEPIETMDENGEAHGIAIDILNRASELCGIQFNYVTADSFASALVSFGDGGADIFSAITCDYGWADKNNMYLTQPYLDIPFVSIYKQELTADRRLALPRGYYITQYMESNGEAPQILYYDTTQECVDAVLAGEADYTFVNSYQADYYLAISKYSALKFRTIQSVSQRLSIAVSQDANPLLFSILCKAIEGVSTKEITAAIRSHTEHSFNAGFFDMVYTNPVQFFGILLLCAVLVIGIGVVSFYYLANRKKNAQLKHALDAKSEFLSNMSHDMRTPMNGILGLLELTLDSPGLPDEARGNLRGIQDSGKYLLSLINDTLDMSKIESNKLTLHYDTVNAEELVRNIVTYVNSFARENGVTLNVHLAGAELGYIRTDPLRLQQIFVNIVSNAVKFTPPGGSVDMTIECYKRENGIAYDRISVKDTGIGMSKEFLPKIFEPFEQENAMTSQISTGTGLGMSIVKKLVEMMGGKIEITSEQGVGTEVVVWVNFQRIYPDAQTDEAEAQGAVSRDDALAGKRVLLAEDHPLNAKIAVKLLEKKHMTTEHAQNGQRAVELFSAAAPGYFDAVLMDIRMPVMDGLAAAKAIRALDRPDAKTVPIIAMTANAFDEDVEKSLSAGMNAHLSKPVEPEKLYAALISLLEAQSGGKDPDHENT